VGATDAPTVFSLDQNEPNPFRGTTAIQFAVPRAGQVRIEIFDLLGRRIRTLADKPFEVGMHSVQWDQRDDHGNLTRPGVYMYRMIAGTFRSQRKMLLTP
jgi:flagellar hook assembly protein FlgD